VLQAVFGSIGIVLMGAKLDFYKVAEKSATARR